MSTAAINREQRRSRAKGISRLAKKEPVLAAEPAAEQPDGAEESGLE